MKRSIISLLVTLLLLSACASTPPDGVGLGNGRLADCPWAPRCVSSQSSDPDLYVAPIHYSGSLRNARQRLLAVLQDLQDIRIIKVEEDYIHAKAISGWLNFIDDIEFLFVDDAPIIHVRSSARVGYYDFDVNRNRVNTIRIRFLSD